MGTMRIRSAGNTSHKIITAFLCKLKEQLPHGNFDIIHGQVQAHFTTTKDFFVYIAPYTKDAPSYVQTHYFIISHNVFNAPLSPPQEKLIHMISNIIRSIERKTDAIAFSRSMIRPTKPTDQARSSGRTKVKHKVASLKLIPRCNVACIFCTEKIYLQNGQHDTFSLRGLKKIIRDFKRNGYEYLCFDGGEPTLSPLLLHGIRFAYICRFPFIGIVTNGINLSDRSFLGRLVRAGLTHVNISIHSLTPCISQKIYGKDISIHQKKALENLISYKGSLSYTVKIVFSAVNHRDIPCTIETIAAYAPTEIVLVNCLPNPSDNYPAMLAPIHTASASIISLIRTFKRKWPDIHLTLENFPYCLIPKELWPEIDLSKAIPVYLTGRGSSDKIITRSKYRHNRMVCVDCFLSKKCQFPLSNYLERFPKSRDKFGPITSADVEL